MGAERGDVAPTAAELRRHITESNKAGTFATKNRFGKSLKISASSPASAKEEDLKESPPLLPTD
jgi:hypothetical protein